ncbi:MAG: hypothetical protein JWO94_2310 [Verrucomicrobiaceae bacterium]|nr:hypothetical protein [Verrucomicrobiaceae bacterium]
MKIVLVWLTFLVVASVSRAEDRQEKLLMSLFGGEEGMKAAGVDKLDEAQKAALLRPFVVMIGNSSLGNGTLAYLQSQGWKRFDYAVTKKDTTDYLVISDGITTWATEATELFTSASGKCLGKGAALGGPSELITQDGQHHSLLLAEWKELGK